VFCERTTVQRPSRVDEHFKRDFQRAVRNFERAVYTTDNESGTYLLVRTSLRARRTLLLLLLLFKLESLARGAGI